MRVTDVPDAPALADRVTVPEELVPPTNELGDSANLVTFWAASVAGSAKKRQITKVRNNFV